ncbi:MAG: hypothetical protein HDQ87_01110 [Clostridia bacterium]|nr:hypothetical protein [Clostridia bacterium]
MLTQALEQSFEDVEVSISALCRSGEREFSMSIGPAQDLDTQERLLKAMLNGLKQAHGWSDRELADFVDTVLS